MKIQMKRLRKEVGFKNRQQFADALSGDYTVRQITSWETGERMMSLSQACDVADLLHCTLDELAGRDFRPAEYSDPFQAELNRCYEACTPERKSGILQAARDGAAMSKDAPEPALPEPQELKEAI